MRGSRAGVFLGLGANLGNPGAQFRVALRQLEVQHAVRVVKQSLLYRTPPWGHADQPEFTNAAVELETEISPPALVQALHALERLAGRDRRGEQRWGPRVLDLDLLLYRDEVWQRPDCLVPHPRLHERAFALVPLAAIAPEVGIPGHGTVHDCLAGLDAVERSAVRAAGPFPVR
jgi:2-amino-4-hydroxy-6-hydroxymethyldihydropteridine diphosphokinase